MREELRDRFTRAFDALAAIGRDQEGSGWSRSAWTAEDRAARAWFAAAADAVGLAVRTDRSGNLWAWLGEAGPGVVVTGSHLDTVPGGGAFDGALGVVAGLLAVDLLRRDGAPLERPVAVVAFADEEGARFNTPCLGSRLLTGALDPAAVLDRRDGQGVTMREAIAGFDLGGLGGVDGLDVRRLGADPVALSRIGAFVELHVEQGRGLVDLGQPVATCSAIWPHARWRLVVRGETNHAGTTRLADRRDPLLVAAAAVGHARREAETAGGVATVGRLDVRPNASNAVAARVDAWLDVRGPDTGVVERVVTAWEAEVRRSAGEHGCDVDVSVESDTPAAAFDAALRARMTASLSRIGLEAPALATAAGHDAGILAAHVPAGMLFVRNPTGVSHSGAEHATVDDCVRGVEALRAVLEDLACRP